MKREATCGGGYSGEAWQAAYAQVAPAGPEVQVLVGCPNLSLFS